MKEGLRSGNPSGTLEKDRVPSGRLIVRKKGDGTSIGGSSGKQKVFESKKEKKRPKLVRSDSESDKELTISHRGKIGSGRDQNSNGAVAKKNSEDYFEHKGEIETDRKRIRPETVKCSADATVYRKDFVEAQNEKKSRMDVFEFNEDDIVDFKKIKAHLDGDGTGILKRKTVGSKPIASSDKRRVFETGCSRGAVANKRKHSNFDRYGRADLSDKKRFKLKNDGTFCPVGSLREKSGVSVSKPIRVQGKNGVLKVMINKKKKLGGSEKTHGHREAEENGNNARSAGSSNWNVRQHPPFYSEKKFHEKPSSSMMTENNQVNSRKISSTKNIKMICSRTEDSDTSIQLGSENMGTRSSKKETSGKGVATLTSEIHLPDRRKEGGKRCGIGIEKQFIRDQIRGLLENAGWTIDLRPRRNKNYQDAVYISPSGTGYWSILNAYYALQKVNSSFTPIPEEALRQLTRKTRKKIERERMMKVKAKRGNKNAKETPIKGSAKNKFVKESMENSINGKELNTLIMHDGKSLKKRTKASSVVGLNMKGLASNAHSLDGTKNKRQRGRALLVRSSNKEMIPDDDDFIPYNGKRTVLTWLIDLGIVPLNGKVKYMNKRHTRVMLEGWITKDGIHCSCCSKILTISEFEIHAGSQLCQPFQNIFVETGASLLQCQVDAWNKQEESERSGFHAIDFNSDDPNDDTCGVCGDGGDLICCDGCPSTFHQSCLDVQVLPSGDWHCLNCSCKICGVVGGSNGDDITVSKLLTCGFCEEKYHGSCIEQINAADSNNISFCGLKCRELFEQLQKILGVKHELEAGYSWTLIRRSDLDSDTSHHELPQKAECNSKLAVALSVMDECFLPIVDRRSGINLIHNVLYNCGSNFNRLNYSGFYTAILERGDEVISAASIRVHGTGLAEMPFIGTRHTYRRQGMCRRLLNAIESALCSLNVEKLIIPAISELMHTWTVVFGFKPLEESHKQEMKYINMLVFPGVDLLQKILVKNEFSEGSVTGDSVAKAVELKSGHHITSEVTNKSDMGSSVRPDVLTSDKATIHHTHTINDKVAAVKTGLQAPGYSIHDTSDVTSNSSDAPDGTILHAFGEETICNNFQSKGKFPESAPATKSLQSLTTLAKPEVITDTPVNPNLQSSTEGAVGNAPDVNVRVISFEPDLRSMDEISIKHTSEVVSEHPDAVSGSNFLAIDGGILQNNPVLNHQDIHDMESKLVEASHPESNATHCEEIILHASVEGSEYDACEVKTEITAVEPVLLPSENNAGYGLEDNSQAISTICEWNCQGSDESSVNPDSQFLQKMKSGLDAADSVPDTCNVKIDVAATEPNSQALGENSVDCVSNVVGVSSYAASTCNYLTSAECRSNDLIPNSFNSSSDVAVLPTFGEAQLNMHDLADETFKAIPGDSSLHTSVVANMFDICKEEVGAASVDPNQHASVHDSLEATSEPIFQVSSESTRFRNSELHNLPDFTLDVAQNVFKGGVLPNHQAFGEANGHDIHDLKGEGATVEPNASVLDENLC